MNNPGLLLSFLFLSLIFAVTTSCAQNSEQPIPPPQPPFVARPRPGTSWEITFQASEKSQKKTEGADSANITKLPYHATTIHCQCGTGVSHVIVNWSDDTSSDAYIKNGRYYQRDPKTKNAFSSPIQENRLDLSFFVSGYQGAHWMTPADYKGIDLIEKEKCYKFTRPEFIPTESTQIPVPELTIWIRVQDKQPVRFRIGELTYIYSAISPASSPIDIPPDIQQVMQQIEKEQKALEILGKANP